MGGACFWRRRLSLLLLLLLLLFHLPMWLCMHRSWRRVRVRDIGHRDKVHRAGWVSPTLRVVLCPCLHILIWVCCIWVIDEWRARHGLLRLLLCMGMYLGLRGLCLWLGLRLRLGLGLLLRYHTLCLRLCLNGYLRLNVVQLWLGLSVKLRLELDLGLLLALKLSRRLSLSRPWLREGFCLLRRLLMIVRCPLVVRCWIWLHVCRLGLGLRGLLHWLRLNLYLMLGLRLGLRLRLWSSI